jgi:hypothetical protein
MDLPVGDRVNHGLNTGTTSARGSECSRIPIFPEDVDAECRYVVSSIAGQGRARMTARETLLFSIYNSLVDDTISLRYVIAKCLLLSSALLGLI